MKKSTWAIVIPILAWGIGYWIGCMRCNRKCTCPEKSGGAGPVPDAAPIPSNVFVHKSVTGQKIPDVKEQPVQDPGGEPESEPIMGW